MDRESQTSQLILDAIPSFVFLKDTANHVLRVNRAVLDSLGLPREEVEGRHARDLYPDDAERFFEDDLRVIQSGQPRLGYHEAAGDRWLQTDKIPLRNANGEVDRLLVVASDITEVKRARELAANLIEASPVGMLLVNPKGTIALVNSLVEEVFALTRDKLIGQSVERLLPELLRGVHKGRHNAFTHDPTSWVMGEGRELYGLRSTGERFPVQVGLSPIKTPDGDYALATIADMTASKAARRELRRSLFATENSSEAIYWVRKDGSFSYVNHAASKMLGRTQEELLSMRVSDIDPDYPPAEWARHWERMRRDRSMALETQHLDAEGVAHWVEMRIHFYDFEGEEFIVGAARDVSARKQTEAALIESEARYRTLFDGSPVMHANVDPKDATIKDCNQLLVRRLGYDKKADLIGRPIFEVYSEDCQNDVEKAFKTFVETGVVKDAALKLQTRLGEQIPVNLNVASVRDPSGRILYSSSTWSDVSELTRANQDLQEFAYIASHDLKAPLRAISHLASWLEEDLGSTLSESSEQHLAQLKQRVSRMESLLDDLLSFSRASRSDEQITPVDLAEMVASIGGLQGPNERFELSLDLGARRFQSRATPLETVLRNLISNAIKHHDGEETPRLEISSRESGGYLEVCVSDNGPGIPVELRERAFKMFQTLRPRDEVEGSGMGLALTKRLVENEGGRVAIEQAEPRGTRVRFTWPYFPADTPTD